MSSIAKIKANNTEYDVVGLGVENVKNDSFIGTWQGTEQEWEQAEITDWRKWQTDAIVGTGTRYSNKNIKVTCFNGENFAGLNGDSFVISDDGVNWTVVGNTGGTYYSSEGGMMIFSNGEYYSTTTSNLYKSSDGLTWTECGSISYATDLIGENGTIIACAGNTNYLYSNDNGNTWSTKQFPSYPSSGYVGIAYGNGTFVVVGDGKTFTSSDGINWSTHTVSGIGGRIAYGNGKFVVATGNNVRYSTDGINWTTVTGVVYSARWTCFSNGSFLVVGGDGGKSYYSVDGINWTDLNTTLNGSPSKPSGGDNTWVVATSGGYVNVYPVSSSSCYTTTTTPTTASTVYSAPNTTSALTITSVGTGTITLSDSQVYNRQAGGDTQTYQDVASLYPNHLAFVDNVGVKIGNTLIADSTDISGKADVDLSNLSTAGKAVISNLSMPSGTYTDVTLGASTTSYTAPADGWYYIKKSSTAANQYLNLYVFDDSALTKEILGTTKSLGGSGTLASYTPIRKGQTLQVVYNVGGSTAYFRFIYAEGEK